MGSGPLRQALRNLASEERLKLIPPAPHNELLDWASGATLGAILYENIGRSQHLCSPNKLWEYAAAGVPCLASDLPEIARVVRGHQTGFTIPPGSDSDLIAERIEALTPEQMSTASTAARRFAQSETWDSEFEPLKLEVQRLLHLQQASVQ